MTDEGVLWFRSKRSRQVRHFADWKSYARDVVGMDEPSLYDVAKTATQRGGTGRKKRELWRRLSTEVPWMTFVLGSGCLMLNDLPAPAGAALNLRDLMTSNLAVVSEAFPGLELADQAIQFVELLTIQRTGRDDVASALASVGLRRDLTPPEYSAHVALAAALATRLYSAGLASGVHVVGPADRDVVGLNPDSWWAAAIEDEVVKPLKHVLGVLKMHELSQLTAQAALAQLASEMDSKLPNLPQKRRVQRAHVELLTAFAWYFLTEGTSIYPGWSELLLFRAFDEDKDWFAREAVRSANPSPRPRVQDLPRQAEWVRERIVGVTNRSWESRQTGRKTERDLFFDLVAAFLLQQSAGTHFMPNDNGSGTPPLPVCLVSSFDLELEMALWAKGEPFLVILPIFVQDPYFDLQRVSLCWMWTEIDPAGRPAVDRESVEAQSPISGSVTSNSALRLPDRLVAPGGWRRLPGGSAPAEFLDGKPIVLRLSGSPLMQSSNLADGELASSGLTPSHALLLDEYTAIHEAALDFKEQGLPTWLTDVANTSSPPRFWMLMGTQLADSGVRLRLMAQQVASRYRPDQKASSNGRAPSVDRPREDAEQTEQTDGAEAMVGEENGRGRGWEQERVGVLINERSQANARDIFLWHDFDIVDSALDRRLVDDLADLHQKLESEFEAILTANSAAGATTGGAR